MHAYTSIIATALALSFAVPAMAQTDDELHEAVPVHRVFTQVLTQDPAKQAGELDAVKQAAVGQITALMQAEQYRLERIVAELNAATTPAEIDNIVTGIK